MKMKTFSVLVDSDVVLKPLTAWELPQTLFIRNLPDVKKYFFNSNHIEPKDHIQWYKDYCENSDLMWSIYYQGRMIGQIGLYNFNDNECELGRLCIDPLFTGKGIAHKAEKLIIKYAFEKLSINRIVGRAKADNDKVICLDKKSGFNMTVVIDNIQYMEILRQ